MPAYLYLHARCHPEAPTWTRVLVHEDRAELICAECQAFIGALQLAPDQIDPDDREPDEMPHLRLVGRTNCVT